MPIILTRIPFTLTKTEILIIHTLCLWKSFNTSGLPLFENPWELTKETRKVSKSIQSNRNYSAILATPSVAEIAEQSRLLRLYIACSCFLFLLDILLWCMDLSTLGLNQIYSHYCRLSYFITPKAHARFLHGR
jgi:hypothetical protein